MKFCKIPHSKYMENRVLPKILKISSELIFLSNRVLQRKSFLIACFFPCYLNGKNEASDASSWNLDSLTVWNIFYYLFGNDFQRENQKTNLGNKECPSIHTTNNQNALKLEKNVGFKMHERISNQSVLSK